MTKLEALKSARHIIRTPDRWSRKGIAHDRNGKELATAKDPDAHSFCIIGAFSRAGSLGDGSNGYFLAVAALRQRLGVESLVWYNNHSPVATHADLMDAFDKEIGLEEAREQFAEEVGA